MAMWPFVRSLTSPARDTIEQARANLVEALTLFFETASPPEVERRLHSEIFVTQVEVPVG